MKMHSGKSNESRYCLHLLLFLTLNVMEAYIYVSIIFANNDVKYATTRFNTMSILYNLVNFIVTCFILWLLWQFSKKNWTRRVEDSLSSDHGSDNPSQRSQRISEGPNSRPQRESEDPSHRSQSEGDDHSERPQRSSQVGEGEREDQSIFDHLSQAETIPVNRLASSQHNDHTEIMFQFMSSAHDLKDFLDRTKPVPRSQSDDKVVSGT